MNNTTDNREYSLPTSSTNDRKTLEQMRRGLQQEIDGLKEQLAGKRQQKSALDKHLGYDKEWGT